MASVLTDWSPLINGVSSPPKIPSMANPALKCIGPLTEKAHRLHVYLTGPTCVSTQTRFALRSPIIDLFFMTSRQSYTPAHLNHILEVTDPIYTPSYSVFTYDEPRDLLIHANFRSAHDHVCKPSHSRRRQLQVFQLPGVPVGGLICMHLLQSGERPPRGARTIMTPSTETTALTPCLQAPEVTEVDLASSPTPSPASS